MTSKRPATSLALALSLLTLPLWPAGAAAQKQEGPSAEVPYLVWPLPPDPPRVRYVGQLRDNFDVEPLRKRSVIQKLIGAPDPNVRRALSKPAGLATDSRGRLIVADSGRAAVFVFDAAQRRVSYLGGDAGLGPKMPLDVEVDSGDRIFVADVGLRSVLVYGAGDKLESVISNSETLLNPAGLALDEARGRLYVLDSQAHQVAVVDLSTLQIVGRFGERGEGAGKLNYPAGIATDAEGRIYVSDTGSCTIQIFSPDYQPVGEFGGQGVSPSQFTRPKQIAIDSEGHVYVIDAAFNNFQIFSADRKVLLFVGTHGSKPGSFNLPFGIHIDASDRIYVSDQLNGRVQVFQFLGGEAGSRSGSR